MKITATKKLAAKEPLAALYPLFTAGFSKIFEWTNRINSGSILYTFIVADSDNKENMITEGKYE